MINEPTASRIAQRLQGCVHKIVEEEGTKHLEIREDGFEFTTKEGETVRIKITTK